MNDEDRRFSFETAVRDFTRVRQAHVDAGYSPITLPYDTVAARADFVLATVNVPIIL